MPPQYLSTDPNAGTPIQPKYLSTDPNAGTAAPSEQDISVSFPTASISAAPSLIRQAASAGFGGSFPYVHPLDAASAALAPIENMTPAGRAAHPIESAIGQGTRGLREFFFGGQAAGKPMGTSGGPADLYMDLEAGKAVANALPDVADYLSNPGKIFSKALRDPKTGKVTVTPTTIAERFIPQRPEIVAKEAEDARNAAFEERAQSLMRRGEEQAQLDSEHEARLRAAEKARQKELADMERLRTQHGQSLMNRGRIVEQEGIRGAAAKPAGKLVLTPEEIRSQDQLYNIAKQRAHVAGMSNAGRMSDPFGGRVPRGTTPMLTPGESGISPEELEGLRNRAMLMPGEDEESQ